MRNDTVISYCYTPNLSPNRSSQNIVRECWKYSFSSIENRIFLFKNHITGYKGRFRDRNAPMPVCFQADAALKNQHWKLPIFICCVTSGSNNCAGIANHVPGPVPVKTFAACNNADFSLVLFNWYGSGDLLTTTVAPLVSGNALSMVYKSHGWRQGIPFGGDTG